MPKKAAAPPKEKAPAKTKAIEKEEKPAASAKKAPAKKEAKAEPQGDLLEVCLLLDTTSSMSSWIERSKQTLKGIVEGIQNSNDGLKARVAFVGYRDIKDVPRFETLDFTSDLDLVTEKISAQRA